MGFKIKLLLAFIFDKLRISDFLLKKLGRKLKNKYIRVVNYHDTKREELGNFKKQIECFKNIYKNISYGEFEKFLMTGELIGNKPGIMLTFDDGLAGNYDYAYKILQKDGMTGYFMVSSDLIGTPGYMTYQQLKEIQSQGHVIGDHTSTHHRMELKDTKEDLEYEILQSKKCLEEKLESTIEIFCWCGGEEQHYTKRAADMVKASGYKYGFMTNSFPITPTNDFFHIQRTNIEANWPMYLVKFQICGLMDWKFKRKRERIDKFLKK